MYPGGTPFQNDTTANIPNMSLMFTMYTTTFGNMSFQVQPPTPGKVAGGFPQVPYLSIEALLYQGQSSNPVVAPLNVQSGSTAGTQLVNSTQIQNDQFGTARLLNGFQPGTSGV